MESGWNEKRTFPAHHVQDASFKLTGDFAAFQDRVLDYCFAVTQRAGRTNGAVDWLSGERSRSCVAWGRRLRLPRVRCAIA